jgi:hypothetical protein
MLLLKKQPKLANIHLHWNQHRHVIYLVIFGDHGDQQLANSYSVCNLSYEGNATVSDHVHFPGAFPGDYMDSLPLRFELEVS